jgi:hypothetical protein
MITLVRLLTALWGFIVPAPSSRTGAWMCSTTHSSPWHWIEVSGQLDASAALPHHRTPAALWPPSKPQTLSRYFCVSFGYRTTESCVVQSIGIVTNTAFHLRLTVVIVGHYATSLKVAGSIPDVTGFCNWRNLPAALRPWGRLSLLTEMSIRNLPEGKGRPARKPDNLTAICEPIV